MEDRNYYHILDDIETIYDDIASEGIDTERRYWIAVTMIVIQFLAALGLGYLIFNGDRSYINLFTPVIIVMIVGSLFGLLIFMYKETNEKYDYYDLEEESLWDNLTGESESKKSYNEIITERLEDRLLEEELLFDIKEDTRILTTYIEMIDKKVERDTVDPMITRGSIAFFVLALTVGVQVVFRLYDKYSDSAVILFAFSLLIFTILISIYSVIYLFAAMYKDAKNRKLTKLKKIATHLEAIYLKRVLEETGEKGRRAHSKRPSLLKMLLGG